MTEEFQYGGIDAAQLPMAGQGEAVPNGSIRLVPTKSDKEIAIDLKQRMQKALEPIIALIREANASEFAVNFDFRPDPYGRTSIEAQLIKKF